MPTVICDKGHTRNWRNQRGSKISDHLCPECGGKLYKAEYVDGTDWVKPAKKTRMKCEIHNRFYYTPQTECRDCEFERWKKEKGYDN